MPAEDSHTITVSNKMSCNLDLFWIFTLALIKGVPQILYVPVLLVNKLRTETDQTQLEGMDPCADKIRQTVLKAHSNTQNAEVGKGQSMIRHQITARAVQYKAKAEN